MPVMAQVFPSVLTSYFKPTDATISLESSLVVSSEESESISVLSSEESEFASVFSSEAPELVPAFSSQAVSRIIPQSNIATRMRDDHFLSFFIKSSSLKIKSAPHQEMHKNASLNAATHSFTYNKGREYIFTNSTPLYQVIYSNVSHRHYTTKIPICKCFFKISFVHRKLTSKNAEESLHFVKKKDTINRIPSNERDFVKLSNESIKQDEERPC